MSTLHFFVFYSFRVQGVVTNPAFQILFILRIIAFEPGYFAVAFKSQHVGGNPIEKPAVMRNHNGTARELE